MSEMGTSIDSLRSQETTDKKEEKTEPKDNEAKKMLNMDEEDLKKLILKKNEEMSLWTVDGYSKQIRKIKKWPQFLAICKKHNF